MDPYVQALAGREHWGVKKETARHEIRGRFLSQEYDWEGDHTLQIPYHQVIAYSLHVRGFTRHASSKVKSKGTFQGIIEKIDYLTDLGINQIHCMPVYEFEDARHIEITGDMEKGSILLLRVHILRMVMGPEDLRIWSKHAIKPE